MKLLAPILRRLGYAPIVKPPPPAGRRSFPAGAINRLTNDWRTTPISINALLHQDLPILRTRARDLAEKNEYFQKYLTMTKTNVLGSEGIQLKNKAADPPRFQERKLVPGMLDLLANKLIEDAWWEWGKKQHCNVAKDLTFLESQQLALETSATDGETLWRKVVGEEAGNPFNFALQPIETDRIDTNKNGKLDNGNIVRLGVEKNSAGQKVAYWLFDADPSEFMHFGPAAHVSKRYDADEFVHPFLVRRIGQVRGFPWAAAAMMRVQMLHGVEEAHVEGTRAAFSKMAFITKNGTGAEYTGPEAEGGGKYMDAEPGMIEELPQGMDIKVVDWQLPNAQYDPFVKACLRGMAAGLNVSYPTLGNDYGEVNFSSGRMAQMEEREFWMLVQNWFACGWIEPVFMEWLNAALLAGAIAVDLGTRKIVLPATKYEKFAQPTWHGRRWKWVDPGKEVSAKEQELANLLTSPTRALAEQGLEEDEILEETKQFLEKCDRLGVPRPKWAIADKPEEEEPADPKDDDDGAPEKPAPKENV